MRSCQKRDRGYGEIVSHKVTHANDGFSPPLNSMPASAISIHTLHCVISKAFGKPSRFICFASLCSVYLRLASSLFEIESMATNANGELVADGATVTGGGT